MPGIPAAVPVPRESTHEAKPYLVDGFIVPSGTLQQTLQFAFVLKAADVFLRVECSVQVRQRRTNRRVWIHELEGLPEF